MLTLYHSGLSTCSKQVRLCLKEKGVAYESRYIELWNYENLNPEYLKLNPNGVVPTLVHDGVPLINALAINEYIDDAWPEPPLKPADPKERAKMRLWTWTADDIHTAVMLATFKALLTDALKGLTEDDIEAMIKAIPVPDRRERWRKFTKGGFSDEEMMAAEAKMSHGMERVEAALDGKDWLAGDMFSLAEISMIAIVNRVKEIRPSMVDDVTFPNTNAWRERIMARPTAPEIFFSGTPETPPRPKVKSISGLTRDLKIAS